MNEATHTFRGHTYRVLRGATHPEYSLTCFATEEADFRDKYWDPKPGQVVIDVGASYGAYALTAAACGAIVHAFEPEVSVLVDLERNRALNGYLDLHCHSDGLWDKIDTVEMATYAPHWPAGTTTGPFRMRTLDSFAFPRVDWLKVDTEGAEARVLSGAQETLRRCKPIVIVEVHAFLDATLLDQCTKLLPSYLCEVLERHPCKMIVGRPCE